MILDDRLVDLLRVEITLLHLDGYLLSSVHDFGPSTVGKGHVQIESVVVLRHLLYLRDEVLNRLGEEVGSAEDVDPNLIFMDYIRFQDFIQIRLVNLHQFSHLVIRPVEVLSGEGI